MLPIVLALIAVLLLAGAAGVGLWASRRRVVETIDLSPPGPATEVAVVDHDDEPTSTAVALHVDRIESDVIVMEISGPEPDGTFHTVPHHHHH
jgi:hypothetical protein